MKLAIGTAQFGLNYGIANTAGQVGDQEISSILTLARSKGIDTIDTAAAYGDSEICLGQAGVADFKVITKLPQMPTDTEKPEIWVREQIEASLANLGLTSVYGYLMHRPEELEGKRGGAIASALREAKHDGLVSRVGISIYDPEQIDRASKKLDMDLVQAPLNLLDRRIVEGGWARTLHDGGVELHSRSCFLQGLLLLGRDALPTAFQRWHDLFDRWHEWLETEQVAATKACLDFACSFAEVHRVVVGVDTERQLAVLMEGLSSAQDLVGADWPDLRTTDAELINPARWKLS